MTPDEIVELARRMREVGVSRFSYEGLRVCLLPPPPKPMDEIRERIAELPPDERLSIASQAQKDLDRDLYGTA